MCVYVLCVFYRIYRELSNNLIQRQKSIKTASKLKDFLKLQISMSNKKKLPVPTLKHKRSRVLGSAASYSSLNSKYKQDESEMKTAQEPDDDTKQAVTAQSSWSLWPSRLSISKDSRLSTQQPTVTNETTNNNSDNSNHNDNGNSNDSDSASTKSVETPPKDDSESLKSVEAHKQREGSWIGWKKPSMTSLKKAAQQANAKKETAAPNSSTPAAADGTVQKGNEGDSVVKERTSSWSFWNNSTSSVNPLTNVILPVGDFKDDATPDATLFESSRVDENELHQSTKKKTPHHNHPPSIVVPEFEKTLPLGTYSSSIVNNYNRLKHTLGFEVEDPKHLYRSEQLKHHNIRKVLIIGVHGFFPTKVLRPLIGEPTGTSIKFANEAEQSILRFIKKENLKDVEVQKIALEKEGKIFDRVNFFFKVLQQWAKELNNADYIYIAAHSQGCPVSILLLSKLITDNVLNFTNNKKVCILAMAGINNGPFYGVDQKLFVRAYSTIESDSMMELFQFQKFDSLISKEFLKALKVVISLNQIKLIFVGSINDQLVPLYSSVCLHIRHPNIFRATYIDGSSNTPSFVSRVVSLANHLHNLGFSDHGVIKEISNTLTGPLTGGGHSKIYNDPNVYDLAVNFSLYTSDLRYEIPLHFKPYNIEHLGINPYHLPWCMRGLLFEAKTNLQGVGGYDADGEIDKLFQEFESWKPETKQLKDMKFRLNGIKSKL